MKKVLLMLVAFVMAATLANAQATVIGSESFDGGTHTFTSTPGSAWTTTTSYQVDGTKSIWGYVPNMAGDSVVLTSPIYDFSSFAYVVLRFQHICKVSPCDEARLEYRLDMAGSGGQWQVVPASAYEGSAAGYLLNPGFFSAASYTAWDENDSIAVPAQSWWREEAFDLSNQVSFDRAQFRFVIKKGNVTGSNISYGWLIDAFKVVASNTAIKMPVVEFISPLPDTVYTTGPFEVKAKVATRTTAPIIPPYLVYTTTYNNTTVVDSILMTAYKGDSLWKATIPRQYMGTDVAYSIHGRDTAGNDASATNGFFVTRMSGGAFAGLHYIGDTTSTLTESYIPFYNTYNYGWSRMVFSSYELPVGNGMITDVAFYPYSYTRTTVTQNQSLYMKVTTDTTVTAAYVNPLNDGATLVWTGSIPGSISTTQAYNITLTNPFMVPAGSNLILYWENMDGTWSGSNSWKYTSTSPTYKAVYSYSDAGMTSGSITRIYNRPVVRFNVKGESYPDNSIELVSIDAPTQDSVFGGIAAPVKVTILNRGLYDIDSALFNWTVNGVLQTPYHWVAANPVHWEFEEQVTIGSYFPTVSGKDTIVVWVNMPNGVVDTVYKDDTLSTVLYGCDAQLGGNYVIGGSVFPTIQDAIDILKLCPPASDVVLQIPSGNVSIGATNFADVTQYFGNHTLTITSLAGDKDSTIITTTGALQLNNVKNLIIKDLTFKQGAASAYPIHFTGACDNVEIANCYFDGTWGTATTYYAIYTNSVKLTNINIHDNIFQGGYCGVRLYGVSNTNRSENVTVANNQFLNQYYYGAYIYYTNADITKNVFHTRDSATASATHNAIYAYYSNLNIIQNKFWNKRTSISTYYGMYLYYINQNEQNIDNYGKIINNEIFTRHTAAGATGLIYTGYSSLKVMYNSIYKQSTGNYAMYVQDVAATRLYMKYNDIVAVGTTATAKLRAYYATGTNYENQRIVSDNNIYGLADTTSAIAAIHIAPNYVDTTVSLLRADYTGMSSRVISEVLTDVNDSVRAGMTGWGCHRGIEPAATDAAVIAIYDCPEGPVFGTSDTIKAVLSNVGMSALTNATINWSYAGVLQTPKTWTGNLAFGENDTVALGVVNHNTNGYIDIIAYINAIANDSIQDNDTIVERPYICSAMSGVYTVGTATSDFETLEEALEKVMLCGFAGDVTLAFQPGTYTTMGINFANFNYATNGHYLILTSTTGDRDDVVFKNKNNTTSAVFSFDNSSYIKLENVTVDNSATMNAYLINFLTNGYNHHITINNCKLLASHATTNGYAVIMKSSSAVAADNIVITNNLIDGNYYGVYFYGGNGTSNYGFNNRVDSNIFTNQYNYPTYFYYAGFSSVSHNQISSKMVGGATTWYGLRFYYCEADIIEGNIISQPSKSISSTIYPMYLYYMNDQGATPVQVKNNVIDAVAMSTSYGMYCYSFNGKIWHNTINMKGTQTVYGIYRSSIPTNGVFEVKNNIIVTTGTSDYPIYLGTAFSTASDDIDANDMHGAANVGYAGGAKATIAAWQSTVTTDHSSVSVLPTFVTKGYFELMDSTGLRVPVLSTVPTDVTGLVRDTITTMGAYQYYDRGNNAYPVSFVGLSGAYPNNTVVPVQVVIANSGLNTLTSLKIYPEVNGVVMGYGYSWTGSLAKGETDTVNIISLTVTDVTKLRVFTDSPNGQSDEQTINDTIETTIVNCDSVLSGVYTVGTATSDFETFEEAWARAKGCGVNNVTFAIDSTLNIGDFVFTEVPSTDNDNRITITSNGSRATLLSDGSPVLWLEDVSNINFVDINIGNGTKDVVVKFSGLCQNITFEGCNLYGPATTTNSMSRVVDANYSSNAATGLRNVKFLNNTLNGGYYGMYLYYVAGASGNMNATNGMEIVGNTISNAYYCGIYSYYYNYITKLNDNTITSRSSASTWYGMYLYYYQTIPELMNNKIKYVSGTGTAYGIYANYYNNYNTTYGSTMPGLMANNEIILNGTSSNAVYGLYVTYYSRWRIYNNSIYAKTSSGSTYGLYLLSSSAAQPLYAYNNIARTYSSSTTNYPLYIGTASYATSGYILTDYNCYYSNQSNRVGYVGAAKTTLAALQTATGHDANSINRNPFPAYTSTTVPSALIMPDTLLLSVPTRDSVKVDIRGIQRGTTTNMGCYGFPPADLDLAIMEVEVDNISGVATQPVLTVMNQGYDDITEFVYATELNNVLQGLDTVTCDMAFLDKEQIQTKPITLLTGDNTLKYYLVSVNGVQDSVPSNDTLTESVYGCTEILNGTYTVGSSTSDFATLAEAMTTVDNCGLAGHVTFAMAAGTYTGVAFGEIEALSATRTLTFTSASGNAADVVFVPASASGAAIQLNDGAAHLRFNNVTINASTTGYYAVDLVGALEDIEFYGCQILGNPTTTSSTYRVVNRANPTSNGPMMRDIRFIKNTVNGGYYGFYMYYTQGSSTNIAENIVGVTIDSNIISNAYYYGIYSYYYNRYHSISYNTITSRSNGSTYYGLYIYYYNNIDTIQCNKILAVGSSTQYAARMYYYLNYTNMTKPLYCANNEFIAHSTSSGTVYGNYFYAYYTRAHLYNNTFRATSNGGTAYGMYGYATSSTYIAEIKNNIFEATTTGTAYPVYYSGPSYMTIDYNNYHSSTGIVGNVAGSAYNTLAAFQTATAQDSNSTNEAPVFESETVSKLVNFSSFVVPTLANVTVDITGEPRGATTLMGAYTEPISQEPAANIVIVNWDKESVKGAQKDVEVKITYSSETTLTSAVIGWSINGVVQTPFNWTFQPSVGLYESAQTVIGSYTFPSDSVKIAVWIDKMNTTYDNAKLDTAEATAYEVPLAELVAPFVPDTTNGLSFNVFVRIQEGSGATINAPVMTTLATMRSNTWQDTITMVLDHDNIWKAAIPQYYYGATVAYTTTISDTLNNTVTLSGQTYLNVGGEDTVSFTGLKESYDSPVNLYYEYSWSRQIYLARELEPQSRGGQITKLAWRYAYTTPYTSTNQTCYMMAVDDSVVTDSYMDPALNPNMKQVWAGSITWQQGWCEITLDTAFDLPANKNLMVIWHNNHGTYPGSAYVFYHHTTNLILTAMCEDDGAFPNYDGWTDQARPDAKFAIASVETYNVKDLAIMALIEPVNSEELCTPDYSSVKVALQNLSKQTHDFSTDSVVVSMEVTTPVQFTASVTVSTGILEEGEIDTIELTNMMPVMTPGQYDFRIWHNYGDSVIYDDTLMTTFVSSRLGLPMDETFGNGMPLTMRVADNNTDYGWEVMYDSNATGTVVPQTDNAMLAFDGSRGALTRLYTSQLDLSGTSEPILDFWYWHDTAATASTLDYTDVRLTFDGGQTFTTLFSVTKNNGTDMGWKQYTYSLDSFVNQSCVILVFEAMRMSLPQFDGEQYIDRIKLTSNQDLAVEEMIIPTLTPCDFTGKELSISLGSLTAQNINFESYPTSLQVNITGATTQSYNVPLTSGTIVGLSHDTLVLDSNFDFNPGTYYVYAKVMTSIDKVSANDVLYDTIIINPSIDVAATQVTGGNDNTNCIGVGSMVNQVVVLENDGNMDMEDVILTLNVYDITGAKVQTIEDTLAGLFAINQTTTHTFAEAYEVPADAMYNVEIVASPMCNATLTYTDVVTECVDQSDVEVTAFINPVDDETCSSVGTNIKVKVRVSNNHPDEDIQGVVLNVVVSANNAQIASWTETLSDIASDSYIDFEFPQGFNVPSEADYTIVAYVNSVDTKSSNDTLSMTKCTDLGVIDQDANAMFLGQNIPNPAKAQTVVNYQVPTEGTVVFTLTTVTGQVIYTTTQEVAAGRNSVEFNTENLAAGIYFYTMDFNGQRLTKKMTVRK